jgi:hypothetical protein
MSRAVVRPDTFAVWKGSSLLIVSTDGRCNEDEPLSGYYFREARFLRTFGICVDGEAPWLCEAAAVSPSILSFTYVFPEVAQFGGGGSGAAGDETPVNARGIPQRALAIAVTYTAGLDSLIVGLRVTNHAKVSIECELAFTLDADFADIQEALSGRREQQALVRRETNDLGITFTYGHEQLHTSRRSK